MATLTDGRRLIDNVRTKDLGYAESIRTEAVLVPVIVTDDGEFVRGLKQQDFELFEDGVAQPIASLVSEDAPLDLVLAIDVSGSMEQALGRREARGQAAAVEAARRAMPPRWSASTTPCSSPPNARRTAGRAKTPSTC